MPVYSTTWEEQWKKKMISVNYGLMISYRNESDSNYAHLHYTHAYVYIHIYTHTYDIWVRFLG